MKSFKERRSIVDSIPKDTFYCYTPLTNMHLMDDGKFGFKIKTCGFYEYKEGIQGHCKLYNCEVDDQVKSCGINE